MDLDDLQSDRHRMLLSQILRQPLQSIQRMPMASTATDDSESKERNAESFLAHNDSSAKTAVPIDALVRQSTHSG